MTCWPWMTLLTLSSRAEATPWSHTFRWGWEEARQGRLLQVPLLLCSHTLTPPATMCRQGGCLYEELGLGEEGAQCAACWQGKEGKEGSLRGTPGGSDCLGAHSVRGLLVCA